jgi:hypothetical protein
MPKLLSPHSSNSFYMYYAYYVIKHIAEHCCSVGTLVYEVKESPESMKNRLQKAINMHLQAQRKKNNFVPTHDQIQSYSITMHRGKNTASCSEISSLAK